MFIFILLSIVLAQKSESETHFCINPIGCANATCECPGFLSFCDVTQDIAGICTATSMFIFLFIKI